MSSVDASTLNPTLAFKLGWQGAAVVAAWLAVALLISYWPNATRHWPMTQGLANFCVGVAVVFSTLSLLGRRLSTLALRLRNATPWLIALPLLLGLWELLTAKLALLPVPFFAPPQALLAVYIEDYPRLADSLLHSALLLGSGVALGAATGFIAGVAIGWSTRIGYWLHPVLRILGPVPSTALLPLCFFLFPSSWSASVFLIALATWFPVTVLTWSGVASVDKAYYDVARTLGAKPGFLIFKVAIPAAMPHVFVGLFMGLGASFSTLVVAEMMGVKSGIGFYLQWAQGWAAYANMYAALLIMALACSGLITGLFLVRDRLLAWQKGTMKW
ncbi:NitT/TauT family transport system permease protein [Pseudomonas synxantha]|uniref:Inner membrane component of binding-protein-dependent transport system n=1 Tax=Pseudomonas synxantha TaxID=47883 RepID=A0AAX3I5E3_9PSED|nr:ABC transporter permease subunit [Pseudomonas synxantha]AZE67662.1 Alkanesulfonates transport system permease protein [Pseudomonas synxantha]KRP43664.1 sulfonate ABC transporter permease [Pseudomonas synxantha]SDU20519.1 NitT/TauT family transport system permease protein [Pseudomonas synxantha]VTQ97985.1 putative inner membrane component of binding-protein-dependent transport system [Pseudomonas synxantha]